MWQIIGEREEIYQECIGGDFIYEYHEDIIATFDEKDLAEQYIKDSKLKQRKRVNYGSDKVFKSKSLLSDCVSARIEQLFSSEIPPHNPEI